MEQFLEFLVKLGQFTAAIACVLIIAEWIAYYISKGWHEGQTKYMSIRVSNTWDVSLFTALAVAIKEGLKTSKKK